MGNDLLVAIASGIGTFVVILAIAVALLKRSEKKGRSRWPRSDAQATFNLNEVRRGRRGRLLRILWHAPVQRLRTAGQLSRRLVRRNKPLAIVLLLVMAAISTEVLTGGSVVSRGDYNITCNAPYVIDGDTFDCDGERIRLAGIDAPEMPGHCRTGRRCTPGDPHAAREHLDGLTAGQVACRQISTDRYGRTIARCRAGGVDLSCAMIASDHAVRRYSYISCL